MSAHQITVQPAGPAWSYAHQEHAHVHPTDGLSRLCRELVALGMSGPAEVRRGCGTLVLTVSHIERLAKKSLREDDKGIRYVKFVPFDPSVFGAKEPAA